MSLSLKCIHVFKGMPERRVFHSFDLVLLPPAALTDAAEEKLRLRGLVGCFALFQYLTVGVEAAGTVYSQARDRMAEARRLLAADVDSSPTTSHCVSRLDSECETLAVQQASLLKYHTGISVLPLATQRQMLTSALSAWPGSAPLWSMYIQVTLFFFWLMTFIFLFYLAQRFSCNLRFRSKTATIVLAGHAAFSTRSSGTPAALCHVSLPLLLNNKGSSWWMQLRGKSGRRMMVRHRKRRLIVDGARSYDPSQKLWQKIKINPCNLLFYSCLLLLF